MHRLGLRERDPLVRDAGAERDLDPFCCGSHHTYWRDAGA